MPNDATHETRVILELLKSLRVSIQEDCSHPDDANFVGAILEQKLREIFDRRPDTRLDEQGRGAERKRFDLAFLLVKECNIALRRRQPDQALEFVDRAVALWRD